MNIDIVSYGDGLLGLRAIEPFEVDGIIYWPPAVAVLARMDGDPDAPPPGTGRVVRRPMISLHEDHGCPESGCEDPTGGLYRDDRWSWSPSAAQRFGVAPVRSGP